LFLRTNAREEFAYLPRLPEAFVAVRFPSGEAGYIPRAQVARFKADYPDAVVID
jgi:hypothetical protein